MFGQAAAARAGQEMAIQMLKKQGKPVPETTKKNRSSISTMSSQSNHKKKQDDLPPMEIVQRSEHSQSDYHFFRRPKFLHRKKDHSSDKTKRTEGEEQETSSFGDLSSDSNNSFGEEYSSTSAGGSSDADLSEYQDNISTGTGKHHTVSILSRRPWDIHDNILQAIGKTPIVRLHRAHVPKGVELYVKCENTNPGGSIKDRLALGIIDWAEAEGLLSPGQTVVEASSGNTGIGLAMVCASKGYPFVCVMSEAFSLERRRLMRYLGAKVVLTPKAHNATGMVIKAQELADKHGYFYAQQFENEANAWIHEQTTGPEIISAFAKKGRPLDHFFMAYGSGGTVLGVSRAFRKTGFQNTKIHLCEPSIAPMISSGIPTKYPQPGEGMVTTFDTAHPSWNPHQMQGWATDFIPSLVSTARAEGGFHYVEQVSGGDAIATARSLAVSEGIFCGISGGGILAAAIRHAQKCEPGTTLLAVITDTGERYMSTDLFASIPTEMTPEEQELADSTPGRSPPPPPPMHGIMPADTDELFDM